MAGDEINCGRRTEDGVEGAVFALDVGGEEKELAVFVNGESGGTAELILVVDVGGFTEAVIRG